MRLYGQEKIPVPYDRGACVGYSALAAT